MYSIGNSHLSVLDITLDDGFDADVVGVASTCVLCDVCYITLCDDGSQFLVIEFDHRVGVIEGGSEPIIEKNIELCLALARCFHDLYIVDGVVLVKGELLAKHALEADVLAPLEMADERNTVEHLAVEVPTDRPVGVAVIEKLHIAHHRERVLMLKVRYIDRWHNQQWEWHLAPLCPHVEAVVYISPTAHPEPFVDTGFGKVELLLARTMSRRR